MKSIERVYREFYQKGVDNNKEKETLNMIDFVSVVGMYEENFSKNTVMDFIYSNSPLARQMKLSVFKDYFKDICVNGDVDWKEEGKIDNSAETRERLSEIYKSACKDSAEEFEECYYNVDIKALNILLDRGFTFGEVDNYFAENNFFGKRVYDKNIINDYVERIIEKVRSIRSKQMEEEKAKAENKYKEIKEILSNNYIEADKISQTQKDGEIALALLIAENFKTETVLNVILENSEDKNKDNITKILNACNKIKRIYIEIGESSNFEDATNFESLYFSYTRNYMEHNAITKLTFEDDCQIAKEILNGLEEAGKAGDHYIKINLAKYSPVALEPWRSEDNYIISVFNKISIDNSKKINKKEINYIETIFKNIRDENDNKFNVFKSSFSSNDYRVILAIRELFIAHYNEQDIIDMFCYKFGVKKGEGKDKLIFSIDKAKKMLKIENELKNTSFKKGLSLRILNNNHIADVKKNGLSAFDAYRLILERKIYDTPSISNRLYETFLDIDMAESCLSQYRDFDKNELKEIIEKSPRATLLSNLNVPEAKDYADNVIKKAEERLNKANEIQYEKDSMESLFYQETNIINQGISINEKLESPYQYSKGALRLMLKGGDELIVKETVLNLANKFKINEPETFTEMIMDNVKSIYERMLNIKNFKEDVEYENKAEKEYMVLMHKKYSLNSYLKANMDIDTIAEMLNTFSKQDISQVVTQKSPWAIELGRTEKYVTNYLIPEADSKRLFIKNKLAKAKPMPRKEIKEDILAEYNDLQIEIRKQYPIISYDSKMEELAVASLLLESFEANCIKEMLDAYSPLKDSQANYGESIVNRVSSIYLQNAKE